jgi:hypothetical protein
MSNAIVPVVPKRNAVTGAGYPTSLTLGELAVNTTTGYVYLGADPGVVQIGIPVAAGTTLNLGTGDGSTVAFAITGGTGTDAGGYLVSVGGIDQPSGWTVAGTTLTFSEAPPAGAAVSVRAILKGEGGGGGGTDIGGRAWAAGATYTEGDLVATSQRETWICIQNANTGNDPTTSPTWWAPQPADAVSLQLRAVAVTTPVAGQILAWRNNAWTPWGHMYAHSIYWSDDQTLANGSYLWTANFTDAVAANVNFIEGAYTITTDSNGLVTKALTQNWYDDSSDLHRVVNLNGTVTQSDEGAGVKAALFDGSGYLNLTTPIAFANNPFTVELFFNPVGTISSLWGQDNGAGNNSKFIAYGEIVIQLTGNGVRTDLNSSSFTASAWNHMAVVRDSSNNVALYLNGTLVDTNAFFGDLGDITQDFNIGWAGENGLGKFTGKIAGFRITNTAVYTSNFTPPTSLLTAISGTRLLLNFEATAVPTV